METTEKNFVDAALEDILKRLRKTIIEQQLDVEIIEGDPDFDITEVDPDFGE
jgi:hypothetical protein